MPGALGEGPLAALDVSAVAGVVAVGRVDLAAPSDGDADGDGVEHAAATTVMVTRATNSRLRRGGGIGLIVARFG
jgi:hypothetical protein